MQESPPAPVPPSGFVNRCLYLLMILATLAGGLLCFCLILISAEEMKRQDVQFTIPTDHSLSGSITLNRNLEGEMSGHIRSETWRDEKVRFERPGTPWVRSGIVLLSAAMLTYLYRLYQIVRRKKSALASTELLAKLSAAGGLAFFAGIDNYHPYPLGLCLIAYAGVGYLAYNHWGRVRAQLYKD